MRRLYDNTLKAIENQRGRVEQGLSIGSGYSWWTLFIRDMVVEYSRQISQSARIHVSLGNQLRCMDQLLSGDISLFVAHEIEGLNRSTGARFIPLTPCRPRLFCTRGPTLARAPRAASAKSRSIPPVTSRTDRKPSPAVFRDLEPHDSGQCGVRSGQICLCLQFAGCLPRLCREHRCGDEPHPM